MEWTEGGRGVELQLHGLRGLLSARFADGGSQATGALDWGASVAAALQVAPRVARFERTSTAGSFLETIWVPDRLPGWVVELRPTGAWRPGVPLEGRLELPAGPGAARWDMADGVLVIEQGPEEAPEAATTVMVLGAEVQPGVAPDAGPPGAPLATAPGREGDKVVVSLQLNPAEPDGRVLLAVLCGPADPVRLRSLAAIAAHRGRARIPADAFCLESGVDEIDESIGWAWARLRDRLRDGPDGRTLSPPVVETGEVVRTALACGLSGVARAALVADPRTADQVEGWLAWVDGFGPDPDFLALRAVLDPSTLEDALRRRVAEAARSAGDPGWADELLAHSSAGGRSVALPTVGSGGEGSPNRDFVPDPEEAVLAWRSRLADTSPVFSATSSSPLTGLLDHLLSFRADAPAGRVHLTPTLPTHWTRMAVRGISCAGTRFDLAYERTRQNDRRLDRWTVRPTEGAVPLTVILRVPAAAQGQTAADAEVRIDGKPAELEVEHRGIRRLLPVQLPLDGERVLEVITPANAREE